MKEGKSKKQINTFQRMADTPAFGVASDPRRARGYDASENATDVPF